MRVLVTGSAGQLGRALIADTPEGIEAIGLPRSELDICDAASVCRAFGQYEPDLLINSAAYTAVDRAESEEAQAFQVNAQAVAILAEECAMRGAPLIHFSTDFVFDGSQGRPYAPEDRTAPLNAYGRSKLAGEAAALAHPRNLVIRTSWVYGNEGHNFVRTILRLLAEKRELRVVSDQVGTPTHARSLARATWALAQRGASGLVHFTDAGVASWYDFAIAIQEESMQIGLIRQEIPIIPVGTAEYPTPARRPAYSVLDKSECWKLLGQPARHWRSELRDMLESEKEHHV